jgi:ATP-binding cassette subfamily B protein
VLDFEPAIANVPAAVDLSHRPAELRFSHVSFRYPTAAPEHNALTDISFTVAPGQVLGIAGPPGSGKSTIAQLIPRFYDTDSGEITVGGTDIRHLTLASLREAVGLVQQDVFLFDTSVRENIAYTDPLIEEAEVFGAAQTAQIHEYIDQLPKGYQSRVGERGVGLSGGQRQRLAIARGLLADPQIIIFDDSSSAIDAATEAELRAALDHRLTGKTIIVIAHRLNILRNADEILVLDQGRITERGTHDALLTGDGLYADLWRLQNGGAA